MPTFSNGVVAPSYTGVKVIEISSEQSDSLHKDKQLHLNCELNQNEYLVLKSTNNSSALGRYVDDKVILLNLKALDKSTALKPRNKEQYFVMDALTDDSLKVVCLTGKAGVGKTLLALAAAVSKVEQKKYDKIILTRPTSQVGRRDLGILPGSVSEKLMPYQINYMCNLEVIFGRAATLDTEHLFRQYNIEVVPMQLLRGASFNNSLIISDENQILNYHEMLTLGTRISEGSKLVIMGDMKQRDEDIRIEHTGLYKFINSPIVKNSRFIASVNLIKSERGEVSEIFSKVFDAE